MKADELRSSIENMQQVELGKILQLPPAASQPAATIRFQQNTTGLQKKMVRHPRTENDRDGESTAH